MNIAVDRMIEETGYIVGDIMPGTNDKFGICRASNHWKPPTQETIRIAFRRRGGAFRLRDVCRWLAKPPYVVLDTLRYMDDVEVTPEGWRQVTR